MYASSVFSILSLMAGLAFSKPVLGVVPTIEAEIRMGTETVSGLALVDQALSLDGIEVGAVPTTPVRIRGLEYRFNASAESGPEPGVAGIGGAMFTVYNDNPNPVNLFVMFDGFPSATGADAFANSQFQQTCVDQCTPVAGSLSLSPDEFETAYNGARQSAGAVLSTLSAFATFLVTQDTLYGPSVFSAWTGKFDLDTPGLRMAFAVLLASNASWTASVNAYANANASTAVSAGRLSIAVAAVPEPEAYAMLLVGLGLVAWFGQRRKPHVARSGSRVI